MKQITDIDCGTCDGVAMADTAFARRLEDLSRLQQAIFDRLCRELEAEIAGIDALSELIRQSQRTTG